VGVLLLVDGFGWLLPVRIVLGALAVGAACLVQPFWHKRPKKKSKPLTRDKAPVLYELVDEVAATLGCNGVDGIRISTDFNASIGHTRSEGWVMTLGLALWSTLSPQERVAVIAHELAHQVNGDQRNGMLVHGAAISMARWSYLLDPRSRITPLRPGVERLAEQLAILLMLPVAAAAAGLSWLLDVLAGRQGLSAEYYADALAARAAGTDAAISGLERLLLAEACVRQLHHIAKFDKAADPWRALADYAAAIPANELERQRRLGRLRLPSINSTHPPTQLRADLVRMLPYEVVKVVMDQGRTAAIDRELAGAVSSATKLLHSYYPR
jgi:Peptidase family M48